VALDEVDDVLHPHPAGQFHGIGHAHGIDVDADAAGIAVARRMDQDPAVAGAQIVDEVLRAHLGQLEHGLHDVFIAGHEGDVQEEVRIVGKVVRGEAFEIVENVFEQGSSIGIGARRTSPASVNLPAVPLKGGLHPGGSSLAVAWEWPLYRLSAPFPKSLPSQPSRRSFPLTNFRVKRSSASSSPMASSRRSPRSSAPCKGTFRPARQALPSTSWNFCFSSTRKGVPSAASHSQLPATGAGTIHL